ncbi:Hypothetical protein PHPALM_13810 [Phytophthora palmivora]|uniref:Uncharacterized protein n=1 Tax=Phytophthora palmivora TaxID=4796 RepID=A0A2P4XWD5_9STRA|nr:Hypothetical protein PHPALM_13810 [Phytophthora palmivora]
MRPNLARLRKASKVIGNISKLVAAVYGTTPSAHNPALDVMSNHRHLLSLLVIMLIPTWTEVTAIEGNTTPLQRQQRGCQRLLSNDGISTKNTTSLETVGSGNEERGLTIPFWSTLKKLTGKSSSLMKRAISLRKGASVVTTMEKNPVVKNVAIALEKNPSSLKTMIKDPAVVRAAGTLDKKFGSFTKADITTLRRTFAKNPVKAKKFDIGIHTIAFVAAGVVMVGLAALLIWALLLALFLKPIIHLTPSNREFLRVCSLHRTDGKRGGTTTYFCDACYGSLPVYLCTKPMHTVDGELRSCWDIWHSSYKNGTDIPENLQGRLGCVRPPLSGGACLLKKKKL